MMYLIFSTHCDKVGDNLEKKIFGGTKLIISLWMQQWKGYFIGAAQWKWRPDNIKCMLTHWARVTHIYVGKVFIIGSDNGLSPGRRQAIIWINVGILLIGPVGTNFSEILIEINTFPFKKMHLSSGKWLSFVSASMC